jgi:aspartyl-tRNA(Asn)/glutamyl-tRNA(Gln) amidotransferase subunit C
VAITREEVLKIAELAKLHFDEAEIGNFAHQFQRILDYIETLKEIDVQGVEPTSHVSLTEGFEKSLFREDETRRSLPVEETLARAPDPGAGHFRVPKVI